MNHPHDDGTAPARASEQLAALGPFFAADFHAAADDHGLAAHPEVPWRPLAELVDDTAVLDGRVASVRAFLAAGTGQDPEAVELRVAASVAHLGTAARLVGPLFALTLVHGRVGMVGVRDLWWQPAESGPFRLSLPTDVLLAPAAAATPLLDSPVFAEVDTAFARFGVSRHILRGNTASALGGAAAALGAVRPALAGAARTLTADLLDHTAVRGAAEIRDDGRLRRRSCCLIYRAAPDKNGPVCGDCVLAGRR